MPMMYAYELKKNGYEVIYVVDRPVSDHLSRPENHFSDVKYPYPDWVVEVTLFSQLLASLTPKLVYYYLRYKLKIDFRTVQAVFLNGFFISLSSFFPSHVNKIALSHGSDIDTWCNKYIVDTLSLSFSNKSFFKFLPQFLISRLIKNIVDFQYDSLVLCDKIIYFPRGFNYFGDKVLDSIDSKGLNIIRRYDVSFEPLKHASRDFKKSEKKLVIFSGVRFIFETFPDGNVGYNKGNDKIIEAISCYYEINKNIEVHFVEKGEDLQAAKHLVKRAGLENVVVWHKQMPMQQLVQLYVKSDICFDQVGEHWMGAIGAYALWLGKPLIANIKHQLASGYWTHTPIMHCETVEDIVKALTYLSVEQHRFITSMESKEFVERNMAPLAVLSSIAEGFSDAR